MLDKQVQDRVARREQQLKEKQDFDKRILEQAKFEMEVEAKKVKDREMQMMKNKLMRDKMLQEAKVKRDEEVAREMQAGKDQA